MASEYEKQRKIWYRKLKATKSQEYPEGFKDIELPDGRFKGLSTEFSRDRATYQYGGLEAKAEYHRLANWFLHEHKFETTLEQVVWEYHVNGLSLRDISITLKKARIKAGKKDFIREILLKLRALMIKKYIK